MLVDKLHASPKDLASRNHMPAMRVFDFLQHAEQVPDLSD